MLVLLIHGPTTLTKYRIVVLRPASIMLLRGVAHTIKPVDYRTLVTGDI